MSAAGLAVLSLKWSNGTLLAVGAAVAGLAGVILGMGAVVFSLMQQATGPRLTAFRALYGKTLRANWLGILGGCAVAAVTAVVGIAVSEAFASIAQALIGLSIGLIAARTIRLAWLMVFYMGADDLDHVPDQPLRSDLGKRTGSQTITLT